MSRLVAITGATGFFGRYIVRAFAARGWRVRILARQPIDHPQLAGLQLDVVSGDLSNKAALRTLVDGADAIVHAAGLIKASSAAAFEAVNIQGTANLARAIEERQVAAKEGHEPNKILHLDDLCSGSDIFFAATGITSGELLKGVRYEDVYAYTQSMVLRSASGTMRIVDAYHPIDKLRAKGLLPEQVALP